MIDIKKVVVNNEVVGNEPNILFSAKTYAWDKPLIEKLGLRTFRNIPSWEKVGLGIVLFPGGEYDVSVKVTVEVCPAQFYKFDITVVPKEGVKGNALRHFRIATASGSFTGYWEKLSPLFSQMAAGIIVFERRQDEEKD